VYEAGINACAIFKVAPQSQTNLHKRGAIDIGGSIVSTGKASGFMAAIDAATGKVAWKTPMPKPMIGGSLATASGLVFSGADDGNLYAFDATTGKILWHANLGIAFGAAPIAYAVNGTEYIAVAAGGTGNGAFIGDGSKTGGTVVVFKLGGSAVHPLPAIIAGSVPNAAQRPSVIGMTKINPWMYVDAKRHHVVINLVAAATADNNGFNYDGYSKGKGTFTVPEGWTVDWIFSNAGALPHSAALVATLKPGAPAVVIGLAPIQTANPTQGIGPKQEQYVSFNTISSGNYYLACLVAGHIESGMWDHFNVSASTTMPSIS
jgi:hypothetical protein